MDELLGNIYSLFNSFYSSQLDLYLWGYECESQSFVGTNVYNIVGLIAIVSILLASIVYYFIINAASWNKLWKWGVYGLIWSLLNMLIATCVFALPALQNGDICEDLVYTGETQVINNIDCWGFGIANLLFAFILFVLFSFISKRFSINCTHTPWKSLFLTRNN